MVRYVDDFVIACRSGQVQRVLDRTKRWLTAKGLELNEAKTRVVDIRHTGINFLGRGMTWRQLRQGRGYLLVEPSAKSRTAMREALRCFFDHWTLWRSIGEVVIEPNRTMRGWAGYFHFRNSTALMSDLGRSSEYRLRRRLWGKHGLVEGHLSGRLHTHYELDAC